MQCIAKYWFAEWDNRIMLALNNFLHKIFTFLYLHKHWHNTHNIHIHRKISDAHTTNSSQQTYAHKYYWVSAANRLQFIFDIFTALSPIHNHQNILSLNVSIECKYLYTQQIICARIETLALIGNQLPYTNSENYEKKNKIIHTGTVLYQKVAQRLWLWLWATRQSALPKKVAQMLWDGSQTQYNQSINKKDTNNVSHTPQT